MTKLFFFVALAIIATTVSVHSHSMHSHYSHHPHSHVKAVSPDNVVHHFAASTDDMIRRYEKSNPSAASEYENVMKELLLEYKTAQMEREADAKAKTEEAKKIKSDSFVTSSIIRPIRPEYESHPDEDKLDAETMREMENILKQQKLDMKHKLKAAAMEKESTNEEQNQVEDEGRRHRETEVEMERRIRAEIHQDMEKEKTMRARIEREHMEEQDRRATEPWGDKSEGIKKSNIAVCLPYPMHEMCDFNIFLGFVWTLLAVLVVKALATSAAQGPAMNGKKSTKDSGNHSKKSKSKSN